VLVCRNVSLDFFNFFSTSESPALILPVSMDVTRPAFQYCLPTLLSAIADSHFVAFDLEFSGIASKQYGPSNTVERGNQTLQQRYEETKEAAERYQVLQIGLTCAWEDTENGLTQSFFKDSQSTMNNI
jgi:hypothetical protein